MRTRSLGRISGRNRRLGPGLALLLLAACGRASPGPVGEPVDGYEPPSRGAGPAGAEVRNSGAAERLVVRPLPAEVEATLLFLHGRAATALPDGGSAWADTEGARVVRFDRRGLVSEVLGGAPPGGPALTGPVFVVRDAVGLLGVEADGRALRFVDGEPDRWITSPLPAPPVGGAGGVTAATRSLFSIHLMAVPADAPLLWVDRGSGARPVGQVREAAQPMLGPVVNAGWVAPTADGSVLYTSAVRPELRWYGPDGALEWSSTWPREGVAEPAFTARGGALMPDFRLIQQAVTFGPDGLAYVLATTGTEGPADRLLVFEADGTWLREGEVAPDAAIYVGPAGHVFVTEPGAALARTESSLSSVAFEPFDLPALVGDGRVRLADHLGKVVVVNFWASWCAPCRGEMPLLDRLYQGVGPSRVVVLGLNEDIAPSDARSFLAELGGVAYPNAEGGGRLRDAYGYRGLPYSVVLDPEGRLVRAVYGFGDSIEPIEDAVRRALGADAP